MKITDENHIKSGEKELVDRIYGVIDWNTIKSIFEEKYCISIQDDGAYRQGDIVVYNNNVAYDLKFDVRATISVLFDRSGNYLAIKSSTEAEEQLKQADNTKSETPHNEGIATPLFTFVEAAKTNEPEDILELTDIVKEEIIELTDIVHETEIAA